MIALGRRDIRLATEVVPRAIFESWQAASSKIRIQNPPVRFARLRGSRNERVCGALARRLGTINGEALF
jgi:hypothetical protein